MEHTIQEMETEYEAFKKIMKDKLLYDELDGESLERMIEQVYWLGHFVGRCREQQFKIMRRGNDDK